MTIPTDWKARGMLFVMAADADDKGVVNSTRLTGLTDLAAGAEAGRYIQRGAGGEPLFRFVTRKLREHYEKPVFLGDHVTLETQTIAIGRKSVTIKVRVMVERDKDGTIEQVGEATAWMVAVNKDGKAVAHGAPEEGPAYMTDLLAFTTQHSECEYPPQPAAVERIFTTRDGNHMGAIFGGLISSEVSGRAYALASRLLAEAHGGVSPPNCSFVITAQEVDFIGPILPGEHVWFHTQVVAVGEHAVIVHVSFNVVRFCDDSVKVGEAAVILVSVDADRKMTPHGIDVSE